MFSARTTPVLRRASFLAAMAMALSCGIASAQMRISDLTQVDTAAFPASAWLVKKESDRLTLACADCEGLVAIDVKLSRGPTGVEGRIRSGETTAATMMDVCRQNAVKTGSECYAITPANLKEAVGFVSDVKVFEGTFAATYTIYQGGDLLVMRNVAGSREEARRIGGLAFRDIAPQIVR